MYLSRIILNPRNGNAARDLANPHDMHRTLMRAFPSAQGGPAPIRHNHGVLYRVDRNGGGNGALVLVQSSIQPDWEPLAAVTEYFMEPPRTKDISRLYDALAAGQVLAFRLRANVTIKTTRRADGDKGAPHRVPLRTDAQAVLWLQRKAESGGFLLEGNDALHGVRVAQDPDIVARRGKNIPPMRFASTCFEGRLRITDAEKFKHSLKHGIGSAKAYGFGLLSVARG